MLEKYPPRCITILNIQYPPLLDRLRLVAFKEHWNVQIFQINLSSFYLEAVFISNFNEIGGRYYITFFY